MPDTRKVLNKATFASVVRQAMARKNFTQEELAREMEKRTGKRPAQTTISYWTRGEKTPNAKALPALLDALDLSWDDVSNPDSHSGRSAGPASRRTSLASERMAPIELIVIEAGVGNGIEIYTEHVTELYWMAEDVMRREYSVAPSRIKEISIHGNSMVPTIQPGERIKVALWEDEPLRDGLIYLILGPLGLMVKRLRFDKNQLHITSDNAHEYPPYSVSREEFERDYRVVAFAVEMSRKL